MRKSDGTCSQCGAAANENDVSCRFCNSMLKEISLPVTKDTDDGGGVVFNTSSAITIGGDVIGRDKKTTVTVTNRSPYRQLSQDQKNKIGATLRMVRRLLVSILQTNDKALPIELETLLQVYTVFAFAGNFDAAKKCVEQMELRVPRIDLASISAIIKSLGEILE